jgi:hypothetical protein
MPEKLDRLRASQGLGGALWVDPRAPQGLIRVDIAHPRNQGLVKKRAFDPGAPPAQGSHESVVVKVGVKGIASNVGDCGGNPATAAIVDQLINC